MAAHRIIALVVCVTMLFQVSRVFAQPTPVEIDGCAKLARVIHSEVASAVSHGPGKSGPWVIDLGQGDLSICTHTTKTVSRAFTSAMKSAGVAVNWSAGQLEAKTHSSAYCLYAFLSHCFPDRSPGYVVDRHHRDFVQSTWSIVARAVMQEMYNSFSSDEVRFRDNDLKLRIGLSLRSVHDLE